MIPIKIDGKEFQIKKLSELSFWEFNEIIIKKECIDLPQYLAAQCDISVKRLLNSKLTTASMPALFQEVFNVVVDDVIKDKKETVEIQGAVRAMSNVEINTFGKSYLFELKRIKHEEKAINLYELSVYALAIGLSGEGDGSDVEVIFNDLLKQNWMKVLPQAFFLHKTTKASRIGRVLLSMIYIGGLKAIRLKMAYYLKKLRKSEKKLRSKNYVQD